MPRAGIFGSVDGSTAELRWSPASPNLITIERRTELLGKAECDGEEYSLSFSIDMVPKVLDFRVGAIH